MTTIDFAGRVAIVTGAGNGLGREYALGLAARGAAVVVNDSGSDERSSVRFADEVVEEILAAGGQAIGNYDSIGNRESAESVVAAAMDHFGRIDILINNAGNQANNRFESMTDDEFDRVLKVHLYGSFCLSQLAYRQMMQQRYGRILFVSSSSGMLGHFIRSNYASAKAGVVGLMHAVSLEGKHYGILANALLPTAGPSQRSQLGKAPSGALLPEWEPMMPENQPEMRAIGADLTASKVASLVLYLVSERCTTTHAMYSAAAGRYARVFVGIGNGWMAPLGHTPDPEEIEAHFSEIEDLSRFEAPFFISDELTAIGRRVQSDKNN